MITKNKTKDVFLTKKQLKDRDTAGTLEEGVIYNTTDEPAGHALKNVDGTLQLLDVDNNVISEVTLPPECDTAELDITYNEDGTLTDEQVTYLQSFTNLMFLKTKQATRNDYTLYRAIKILGANNQVNGYTFMGFPSPTKNIGGSISELMIAFPAKKYKWTIRNVGAYLLSTVEYNVSGTLSDSQLSDIKRILTGASSRGGGWLMHITIKGVNDGKDYLIYSSNKLIVNTSISFICEGYKKIIIDLTTGAYTFEESSPEITYATDADIDGLFATYYTLTFSGDELSVSVNGKSVSSPFFFAKGDKIVVNNSIGNFAATINGELYKSGSKTISLIDQDITITQSGPSMGTYSVTINTK